MAENDQQQQQPPPPPSIAAPRVRHGLDSKYDACLDLSIRRVAYSSLAGAAGALLLFRSPTTRWASLAFGAGVGIGVAYTECSYILEGSTVKWPSPNVPTVQTAPQEEQK